MESRSTKKGKYHVLHLSGESISSNELDELRKKLTMIAENEKLVAVNLSNLKYANSQFLSQLMMLYQAMYKKKGSMAIVSPKDKVLDLLRITGIDKVVPIYLSEKEFETVAAQQ